MALNVNSGGSGALLDGRRVVTEFRGWTAASREEGGGIRVWVQRHSPDAYGWSHHGPDLTAELEIGKAVWTGPVQIENTEPLIFTMEVAV